MLDQSPLLLAKHIVNGDRLASTDSWSLQVSQEAYPAQVLGLRAGSGIYTGKRMAPNLRSLEKRH